MKWWPQVETVLYCIIFLLVTYGAHLGNRTCRFQSSTSRIPARQLSEMIFRRSGCLMLRTRQQHTQSDVVSGGWHAVTPKTAAKFSAVAFFRARAARALTLNATCLDRGIQALHHVNFAYATAAGPLFYELPRKALAPSAGHMRPEAINTVFRLKLVLECALLWAT